MRRAIVTALGLALACASARADIRSAPANGILRGTSGSIGGTALLAGGCATGAIIVTISGAVTGMVVGVTPNAYPGAGITWAGYVSAANTITVNVCAEVAMTPAATTYNVRVTP